MTADAVQGSVDTSKRRFVEFTTGTGAHVLNGCIVVALDLGLRQVATAHGVRSQLIIIPRQGRIRRMFTLFVTEQTLLDFFRYSIVGFCSFQLGVPVHLFF